jgi:hypothetical protein
MYQVFRATVKFIICFSNNKMAYHGRFKMTRHINEGQPGSSTCLENLLVDHDKRYGNIFVFDGTQWTIGNIDTMLTSYKPCKTDQEETTDLEGSTSVPVAGPTGPSAVSYTHLTLPTM